MSEPNYHTTKWFSENLLAIEMKKTVIKANKPIYLRLAILSLSKIRMYEYWYDDMKPKYGKNIRLYYMDTDSFIMEIETEDFYKDITMLKKIMIHQITLVKDHYQRVKIRKKLC